MFNSHCRDPVYISGKHWVIYNRDENLVNTPMAHTWQKQELVYVCVCMYVCVCVCVCVSKVLPAVQIKNSRRVSLLAVKCTISVTYVSGHRVLFCADSTEEVDMRGALWEMGR